MALRTTAAARSRTRRARVGTCVAIVVFFAATAACGGGGDDPSSSGPTTQTGPRPESTATLSIVSPKAGAVVHGTSVDLEVDLEGARIVPQTTKDVTPDTGHLHVFLDDELVTMTSDVEQRIAGLTPGPHRIQVEFVAADHAPFDPRVFAITAFEVR